MSEPEAIEHYKKKANKYKSKYADLKKSNTMPPNNMYEEKDGDKKKLLAKIEELQEEIKSQKKQNSEYKKGLKQVAEESKVEIGQLE